MSFKAPHVSFVSFAVEVLPSGITQVMIVETALHLDPKHPSYNQSAVETLISAAQKYAGANIEGPAAIRLVSTQSGEI
ncbi:MULTISPECIES: hypothetical protein [unclassified Bradyrhizobium]|uniref:hypothetical protein n=1 Tax=unclassified Bradyrhizobium TaxID=2631580 RepID=UPI000B81BAF3|nr:MULTISPECIES: hypothetical protein [unclassified Bradyrhizobium]MBB4383693.1 hypothetical protein [Bradyrhizobium sp. SBR1B]